MDISKPISTRMIFVKPLILTLSIQLIPLFAMFFSNDVSWSLRDFLVMGTLIYSSGCLYLWIKYKTVLRYKKLLLLFVPVLFIFLWVELAVGILH